MLMVQMRDRTEEARRIVGNYEHFDFVPIRIEDAFDEAWWTRVGGHFSQLAIDIADEGTLPSFLSRP